MRRNLMISTLLSALVITLGVAYAEDAKPQTREQSKEKAKAQERIYGSQLMTQQERNAYRAKMRAAKTQEECDQLRLEHHKQMQERAKEKGVTLPDEPPMGGKGMMGPGGGMGPGSGMGPKDGMGPRGGNR